MTTNRHIQLTVGTENKLCGERIPDASACWMTTLQAGIRKMPNLFHNNCQLHKLEFCCLSFTTYPRHTQRHMYGEVFPMLRTDFQNPDGTPLRKHTGNISACAGNNRVASALFFAQTPENY